MYRVNTALYPIENRLSLYENEKTDLEAKETFYSNSISLDQE